MRHRSWAFIVVLALSATTTPEEVRHIGGSHPIADGRALHPGAIFELRLRIPWTKVDAYLAKYARWYQPVDQQPGSGRKLLDVLLREHGDHYNVVFLYWYQSRYKKDYYCSYYRAFFGVHEKDPAFQEIHREIAMKEGRAPDVAKTIAELQKCDPDNLPVVPSEVIRKIDSSLRELVELDESTWNVGVNPCVSSKLAAPSSSEREAGLKTCKELSLETWLHTELPPEKP